MNNLVESAQLARLEIGFRQDATQLKALENELNGMLSLARHFGDKHEASVEWNEKWQRYWNEVEALLRQILALINEMHDTVESAEGARLDAALATWEKMRTDDNELIAVLTAIRAQAGSLKSSVRKDWNDLADFIEPILEKIYTCAQAMRVKLVLLNGRSKAEVDELVANMYSKQTNADSKATVKYQKAYDEASKELAQEKYEVMGFVEDIKTMFMWVETHEERMHTKHSIEVD